MSFVRWNDVLIDYIQNPSRYSSEILKITPNYSLITDKYPKARFHYLLVAAADIQNMYALKPEHIALLKEFRNELEEMKLKYPNVQFLNGFHMKPSLNRLHFHIISQDMVSFCMKNKQHYNSFVTPFLKPIDECIVALEKYARIEKEDALADEYLKKDLRCHLCGLRVKNFPHLKSHLPTHIQ